MPLEISHVSKSFPGHGGRPTPVLRDVSLTIADGEFVTFIGHSGCGKSTLLNIIGGLLSPDGGSVSLDSQVVTAPGPDRAMVFQHYSLLPWLSVEENVRTAVRSARPDRDSAENEAQIERYLRLVGLWEHRKKRPTQISGGMQQRTAVARAFAVGPKVLLLDEPFGALDALTRARLQSQLLDLWTEDHGTETVLMVTHGINEAIYLADRVVVMATHPRPSIAEVFTVDIPRPRALATIGEDPRYQDIYARLMRLVTTDLAPESEELAA